MTNVKRNRLNQESGSPSGEDTLKPYNWVLWLAGGLSAALCLAMLVVFIAQSIRLGWSFAESPINYVDFGIFIGSLMTPVVAAASLLLFWKTLRVQIRELKVSSESLKSASLTTQRLLQQERDLFELRQLNEVITASHDTVLQLRQKAFVITDKEYDPVTETGGVRESFETLVPFRSLTDPSEPIDQDQLLKKALLYDNQNLEAHLNLIINLSSNLVKYAHFGGDISHVKSSYDEMLRITEPFCTREDDLEALMTKFGIANKVVALSKIFEALLTFKSESEGKLSNLIFDKK